MRLSYPNPAGVQVTLFNGLIVQAVRQKGGETRGRFGKTPDLRSDCKLAVSREGRGEHHTRSERGFLQSYILAPVSGVTPEF
jgi:hypothetical protein